MAKGENIFKRKDGRWEARYIKERASSGKIQYGFCYGRTYAEAKEKAAQQRAALLNRQSLPQAEPHHSFTDCCDTWLRLRAGEIRVSTYAKYRTILEKHIKPALGEFLPAEITTERVHRFSEELLIGKKLSGKTVYDTLVVLRSVLKYVAAQSPDSFPMVEIHYPKTNSKETRVLSRTEQQRFIQYLSENMDPCKFGILLAMFSGIRIGELCALSWGDIDLAEGTICIKSTLQRLPNTEAAESRRTHIVVGVPKSNSSARTIPMADRAAALCHRFAVYNDKAYILTGTEHYMDPRTLQYRLQKYTRACGLNGVHAHTLRHTFATRAIEAGFEIKSLSEILGHTTTTITLERYVHASMELKRTNMNKLTSVGL